MEKMIFPIEVGQEVFLQPTGNLASMYSIRLRSGTIVKIARKYFYVKTGAPGLEKFEIESFININDDCNSAWVLWPSVAAYEETVELDRKLQYIRRYFQHRYQGNQIPPEVINAVYAVISKE